MSYKTRGSEDNTMSQGHWPSDSREEGISIVDAFGNIMIHIGLV